MIHGVKMPFAKDRTVKIASDRDVRKGIDNALRSVRLTLPQLRDEARTGEFSSERARLVWSAIRDVVPQD